MNHLRKQNEKDAVSDICRLHGLTWHPKALTVSDADVIFNEAAREQKSRKLNMIPTL